MPDFSFDPLKLLHYEAEHAYLLNKQSLLIKHTFIIFFLKVIVTPWHLVQWYIRVSVCCYVSLSAQEDDISKHIPSPAQWKASE